MKSLLPKLLDYNQSGYVPGRNNSENTLSSWYNGLYKKLIRTVFSIAFEKALDSLKWTFLEKRLNQFIYRPDFIKWISIFYKDIQSYTMKIGYCSHYFKTDRGVSPGGGYSQKNWVGVCDPLPKTLTLFMTKICDFPYPIYDLTKNLIPYLWPDP